MLSGEYMASFFAYAKHCSLTNIGPSPREFDRDRSQLVRVEAENLAE